jgi:hypothetical protein
VKEQTTEGEIVRLRVLLPTALLALLVLLVVVGCGHGGGY